MAKLYFSDDEIKNGSAAAQFKNEQLANKNVSAPQLSWSETMNKNLGIANGVVTQPVFTPPKPDVVNPEYGVQSPTFSPTATLTPAPVPTPAPAPVYDYKTDPAFLSWKSQQDNSLNTLNQNYSKLQGDYASAQGEINKYKPYEDKYNQTLSQLTATQANYDDANNRLSTLQKAQVKSIDSNQNQNATVNAAPANMQSYNDNRNASNDQWWSKYLTGGR